MKRLALVLVPLTAVAALSACSGEASVGTTKKISASTLEQKVSDGLAQSVGQAPDDVSCPDDIEAKVGASTRCTLTDGSTKYGVSVKVDKMDGDQYHLDIQVDQKPLQ